MNKRILALFKRDFLINQLMQLYSALLILISILIMLGLSVYTGVDRFRMSNRLVDATSTYLDTYIQERNTIVSEVLGEFTSSDATFESLRNYLQLSIADYFSYSNDMFRQSGQNIYLPNILYRLISSHPDIEEIIVQLDESKDYLVATPDRPYGEKLRGDQIQLKNRLYFARSIAQPSNFAQPMGQVFVVFNEENVLANRSDENREHGIKSFIYTSSGQRLYKDAPNLNQAMIDKIDQAMANNQKEIVPKLSHDFYIKKQGNINGEITLVLLDKQVIWRDVLNYTLLIFGCGTLILFVLLLILHRTFKRYTQQVKQEELADVVYAFSALLRNNTTQEKIKTLAEEVTFCEKYVYLYQTRYPDKIAYHVTIEEDLKHLLLPKFTLQPLVENYFVHGIDYQRNDNAISIKAFRQNGKILLQVRDNGKGADPEQLAMIRQELADDRVVVQTSIGMKNVHERLRGMFGDHYQMEVESEKNHGFKISIAIDEEMLNDEFI